MKCKKLTFGLGGAYLVGIPLHGPPCTLLSIGHYPHHPPCKERLGVGGCRVGMHRLHGVPVFGAFGAGVILENEFKQLVLQYIALSIYLLLLCGGKTECQWQTTAILIVFWAWSVHPKVYK